MTSSQKSQWEKRAQDWIVENQWRSDFSANRESYLSGVSDCFAEVAGRLERLRHALKDECYCTYADTHKVECDPCRILKEDDQ
jgi:hypothetical protein